MRALFQHLTFPGPLWQDYLALTKPRLASLSILTSIASFYVAAGGRIPPFLFFHFVIGTALVIGGASGINMFLERDLDVKMERTKNRPLPARRLFPMEALVFSSGLSCGGFFYLAFFVNFLTGLLSLASLLIYVFLYTPLKQKTSWCTLIGAIPGAIPPLMGWSAVENRLNVAAFSFFAILFFWQLPHFLAIGWMYREDYARAGYKVLPAIDAKGIKTGAMAFLFSLFLLPVSLLPITLGLAGSLYFKGIFILGLFYILLSFALLMGRKLLFARILFIYSLIYLTGHIFLIMVDRMA